MKQRTFVYLVAALFIAVPAASAEAIKIVSPSETEAMEGNSLTIGGPSGRVQLLYPAADFMSLPKSHRTITGLAFRPDVSNTFTDPVSGPARIMLSTTAADELVTTFARNIGDDAIVAYDRTITFQTDDTGPGPREFDFIVPFDAPFTYDPNEGKNLLVEFVPSADWDNVGNWQLDRQNNTTGAITQLAASSPSGRTGFDHAFLWVAEFTFVPEPSSLMLAIGMLGLLLPLRRISLTF